jgi:hypothetical protein
MSLISEKADMALSSSSVRRQAHSISNLLFSQSLFSISLFSGGILATLFSPLRIYIMQFYYSTAFGGLSKVSGGKSLLSQQRKKYGEV